MYENVQLNSFIPLRILSKTNDHRPDNTRLSTHLHFLLFQSARICLFPFFHFVYVPSLTDFVPTDARSIPLRGRYSSNLTTNSAKYTRGCIQPYYYYEVLEVNVDEDGDYTLTGVSEMHIHGYLYKNTFNAFDPSANRINENDDSCCLKPFKLIHYLEKRTSYILVVTTSEPNELGAFSVFALGPSSVSLKYSGECTPRVRKVKQAFLIRYAKFLIRIRCRVKAKRILSIYISFHYNLR